MNSNKFTFNAKEIRKLRQRENVKKCFNDKFHNKKWYNPEALKRFIEHYNEISNNEISIFDIRKDESLLHHASLYCALDASRQGTKDETVIINGIDDVYKNIRIEDLSATAYRPMNNGQVMTENIMKFNDLTKEDGLKTFDFKISGNIEGWGTAKVCMSSGGHQDNVMREIIDFIDWSNKHNEPNKKYVALLDGDGHNFDMLKNKVKQSNIWIVDHIDFQNKLNEYE